MPIGSAAARTSHASGRLFFQMIFLGALLALFVQGCGSRDPGSGVGLPEVRQDPPIEEGAMAPAGQAAAGRLLTRARDAIRGGAYRTAAEVAREVVDRYPRAPGSSRALRILAEAQVGLQEWEEAEGAAARYAELFTPSDPRHQGAVVLQAEARFGMGRPGEALRALLRLPRSVDPALMAEFASELEVARTGTDPAILEELVDDPAGDRPLLAPFLAELAATAHFQGERARAESLARRALDAGVRGEPRELATAVLDQRVEEVLGAAPILGALLPRSGSPTLRRIAGLVDEGVQVALEDQRRNRRPVRVQVADDGGVAGRAVTRYRSLEGQAVVGVVGPILDELIDAVARIRGRTLPLVSPTASDVPRGLRGVYSVSGPDPAQAEVLARYANRAGFETVALVYPRTVEAGEQARAFTRVFEAGGGTVLADLPYEPGARSFDEQFDRVSELRPEAVVLPVPARELEVLAPQVAFFGLDTLNIRTLGTGGWTNSAVLQAVDDRHTDSVVAVAARASGKADSTWNVFVEEYEALHRKSLRSPIPALGFDAAELLMEGLGRGARTPEGLIGAMEEIENFPGATGLLSVEDGRVVRGWFPVLILDRELIPLDSMAPPPLGPLEPPPPPPDTASADSLDADTTRLGSVWSRRGSPLPEAELREPRNRGPGKDTRLPAREGRAGVRAPREPGRRRGSPCP